MFQVVFHSRMAEEADHFDMDDVLDTLTEKMVHRHPHVFEDSGDRASEEQTFAWEDIKAKERAAKLQTGSILDGVPIALPALTRSEKLQKCAAHAGFDWPSLDGDIDKIIEEARELSDASTSLSADKIEDEMGNLLFALTNLARKLKVDPEKALRRANHKFIKRFQFMEKEAESNGQNVENVTPDEMELLWKRRKSRISTQIHRDNASAICQNRHL